MNKRRISTLYKVLAALALLELLSLQATGCDSAYEGVRKPNQPPVVWLTSGPPEGSVWSYKVHFFWYGYDPDGNIRYFEFAITDNEDGAFDPADTTGSDKWHRTYVYDSVFTFTADEIADSSEIEWITEFTRSHTFFVRAVDDKGLASDIPAYRSFTARTLSPVADITDPPYNGYNPAYLLPIATFRWEAKDYIDDLHATQEPESIRWIIVNTEEHNSSFNDALEYIRTHPNAPEWSAWHYYKAPQDRGKFWTSPPLDYGTYMFAVQAKDEAGAVTPVFDERHNARRVVISCRPTGPMLTVRNPYIGTLRSAWITEAYSIVDVFAGIPLAFEWTATAESYGGKVLDYRYGWDITDFNDDDQWDIDWTPFPCRSCRVLSPSWTFYFGTHTFHVEAIDNAGFKSRINIKINFFPVTMERDLLVVDDYEEEPAVCGLVRSNGAMPCDDEHDAFWVGLMQNIEGFNPLIDLIEVSTNNPLPLTTLAQYKSVVWDAYGGYAKLTSKLPFLYDVIKFRYEDPKAPIIGKIEANMLALYLAVGGHVMICGEQPMTMVINRQLVPNPKFPFIFKYELSGDKDGDYSDQIDDPIGDESFAYKEMCLDVLDIAYTDPLSLRKPGSGENGCGVTHIRGVRPKEDGLREALPLDPNFPHIALRPEVSEPGKFFAPDARGLNNELYDPPYFTCGRMDLGPRMCFEPIYGHGCLDPASPIYAAPIAAWTTMFQDVVPEIAGGIAARSAVWGFEPFYFDTTAVRHALEVILFDEWKLPRK
ncbi:MAG: hypothetical protein GTO51_02560 [Candidatus Latescibacteria bacterium]|nr:hypothetical protein [Candidatus Latescibacterota bacterium]NIM22564.1 hypothetical protein [Candidatus Latescibacterota bacterium]NIM64853.1 hypothetical protein [Candidatus Latescibacterota bacterium]NIO01368.1 hypothetical protein [Candidatus Latescibacterota bacterium]NIO27878.1 hypothetical protein [Candidatus Latescibacterota bacterium]